MENNVKQNLVTKYVVKVKKKKKAMYKCVKKTTKTEQKDFGMWWYLNLTSKDSGVWTDGEKKAFSVDG